MKFFCLTSLVILLLTFTSCKEDGSNPNASPQISKISGNSFLIGDQITITGSGFGNQRGTNIVSFNGTQARTYVYWSDKEIITFIPYGANSGKLAVYMNDTKSNEIDYIINSKSITEVNINGQVWMDRNLDVDRYRNGDIIPQIKDSTEWVNAKFGAWCYYNNDSANGAVYGKLYNWYAVNDPRGLAPEGWVVSSATHWYYLMTNLGGYYVAGGKLKTKGTSRWLYPNYGATNETNFSALPSGCRADGSLFQNIGSLACWWTTDSLDNYRIKAKGIENNSSNMDEYLVMKFVGLAVRCVRE